MCGRYYIDSDMADEIEKVVHDIDQRIRQEHFAGDIFPTKMCIRDSIVKSIIFQ